MDNCLLCEHELNAFDAALPVYRNTTPGGEALPGLYIHARCVHERVARLPGCRAPAIPTTQPQAPPRALAPVVPDRAPVQVVAVHFFLQHDVDPGRPAKLVVVLGAGVSEA
jgi:hypothetical protein